MRRELTSMSWREMLRGLRQPRRLIPIAAVALALIATEWFATGSIDATLALVLFIVAVVTTVPALYRQTTRGSAWMALYLVVCGGMVVGVCGVAPYVLGYRSYVAHTPAAVAIAVLVAMTGWVLGRDLDLSDGLRLERDRSVALQLQAEDARLVALRTQLDPHFLFNTLGAIAEWCREDPQVAERALLELSSMLRTLFDGVREPWWPLTRELELLRALQHLYAVRDDERYAVEFHVEQAPKLAVPPLILLPIFENALTHGSGEHPMSLSITANDATIELSMWNPGEYDGPREGGTGIDTTRKRLQLAYGESAHLLVENHAIGQVAGTRATLTLPATLPVDSQP